MRQQGVVHSFHVHRWSWTAFPFVQPYWGSITWHPFSSPRTWILFVTIWIRALDEKAEYSGYSTPQALSMHVLKTPSSFLARFVLFCSYAAVPLWLHKERYDVPGRGGAWERFLVCLKARIPEAARLTLNVLIGSNSEKIKRHFPFQYLVFFRTTDLFSF